MSLHRTKPTTPLFYPKRTPSVCNLNKTPYTTTNTPAPAKSLSPPPNKSPTNET
ncbi:hypothetical protein [Moraxella lacunata]|uniref:hypothetical protein n=1 Tax=Moraxella lacunata TaxID=477 RepID=UPI003EDF9522